MEGDHEVAQGRGTDNLDLTGIDNKERHVGLAAFDQHLTARDWTKHSVGRNPRYLPGSQRRKHEWRSRGARQRRRTSHLGSTSSGDMNCVCARDVDTPNVAVYGNGVRFEWVLRRPTQHGPRPHVELRAVQRACHRRAVDRAFTQRTLPVRALGLRRARPSFDVEHRHIAHQQDRSRWHFVGSELVLLDRRSLLVPAAG
jgi:hypothetical protein